MKIKYIFETKYEKFCLNIFNLLVENSKQTFVCGGTVRDIILNKKLSDFDIATDLHWQNVYNQIISFCRLNKKKVLVYKNFGVVKIFFNHKLSVDISTFRKETYLHSSYPKVDFIKSAKEDSKRRDFTINSLYLSLNNKKLLDFHKGKSDIDKKTIKFIGLPKTRITEDPFRMVRALRLCLELNFRIEKKSWLAIKEYFAQTKLGSSTKLFSEINKLKNQKKLFQNIIFKKNSLDKIEKKFYDYNT